ncbi:PEP-CTERM/exosortase system-associated acyltransferase [Massilia arenosa]|uniref:PEP-CTERM/exosortase system-associated acyltransferase n=1 Tax=Zemynaea arenosa TaxID=2561931 RepID=A0A4Y9SBV5_9BURK|nr:PEP-CTERM/exosortase system-associated acyltransferase [Massilia arenosa]TFW19436.1 PEP-CTERM/exosortase system-associated acyltransferase [Massilia arenosa]
MAPLLRKTDSDTTAVRPDLPAFTPSPDQLASKVFRSFAGSKMADVPRDIFRLRYEVYCLECAFLDPADFHAQMEFDEYDACSHHFAAYSIDETLVGTVRLVRPPAGEQEWPLERHCRLYPEVTLPPTAETAEISRLAVRKTHRRRRSDSLWGMPGRLSLEEIEEPPPHALRSRESPMLLLGLYREMYRYSRANGVRYWLAAMERALARSLERMGFRFRPIGPQCDYYGAVTPYILDLHALYENLAASNPALATWFAEPA